MLVAASVLFRTRPRAMLPSLSRSLLRPSPLSRPRTLISLSGWSLVCALSLSLSPLCFSIRVSPHLAGRYVIAEAGVLLTKVTQIKEKGEKRYVGVDSGFNSLIRPMLYGAYHHMVNLTRIQEPTTWTASIVVRSLVLLSILPSSPGHDLRVWRRLRL